MARREPPAGWHGGDIKPLNWLKAIKPVRLSPAGRAVALSLALAADRETGDNARPGLSRLQWETGASRTSVVKALAELEGMWFIYCRERSTGRGHATVWVLCLHDEIMTYGLSYTAWLKARRPADVRPVKGLDGDPLSELKGLRPQAKGSRDGPVKGLDGDRTRFTPGKNSPVRLVPRRLSTPCRGDEAEATFLRELASGALDEWDMEDALDELLGPDELERGKIENMLSAGYHPKAVINAIKADR